MSVTVIVASLSPEVTATFTEPPEGVWRIAFDSRLPITWRIRAGSTSTLGSCSAISVVSEMPAASACERNDSTVSWTRTPMSVGSLCRTRLPASVRTSVRRSSTRRSIVWVASRIGARCAASAG